MTTTKENEMFLTLLSFEIWQVLYKLFKRLALFAAFVVMSGKERYLRTYELYDRVSADAYVRTSGLRKGRVLYVNPHYYSYVQ